MSSYRRYDHRSKNLIATTGDIHLFPQLDIPASSRRQWVKSGPVEVVTVDCLNQSVDYLAHQNDILRREVDGLKTEYDLQTKTFRIFGFQINTGDFLQQKIR